MNHFSYPVTVVQINMFEEPQNIFFSIKIQDPKPSSQPSSIFNHRVPPSHWVFACLKCWRQLPTWRLNYYFLQVINQLHETTCIPSYAELVSTCLKYQVLLTAEVISWLPLTTIGSGGFLCVFFVSAWPSMNRYRPWYVKSCYFSILFAVITLTSSKSESHSEAVELILLLKASWRLALAWSCYLQDISALNPWFHVWIF